MESGGSGNIPGRSRYQPGFVAVSYDLRILPLILKIKGGMHVWQNDLRS